MSKNAPTAAEKNAILDAIEPHDPLVPLRTRKRDARVGTGVGDFEHAAVKPEKPRRTGVCAVSGCGEELSSGTYTDDRHANMLCLGCFDYGRKKVFAARDPRGKSKPVYMDEILRALGVNFDERRGPTTGRSAAYRHGRGGWYGHERRE